MDLTLQSVEKNYSSFRALKELNITLNSGEITGLLGANGAGKTTFLKILGGYFNPTHGTIRFNGVDLEPDSICLREQASYLAEGTPLHNNRTPRELFEEYFTLYHGRSATREEYKISSEIFKWEEEADKKIRQLSKGYRQRVGLSLAFIKKGGIVLLDEPFSGLDPVYVKGLRELLKEQKHERIILFSSHILQEVFSLCDRIIILSKGEIKGDYTHKKFSSWEELDEEYNRLCGSTTEGGKGE